VSLGIVILTKGNLPILFTCLDSIIKNTSKTDYNIYIGDTGSTKEEQQKTIEFIKDRFNDSKNVNLHLFNRYNFAKCNNYIVKNIVKDEYILLCNNDIELITDSVDQLFYMHRNESTSIGSSGCRLIYPELDTIQHAGQFARIIKNPTNEFGALHVGHRGQHTKEKYSQWEPIMGNTGGFMIVSRDVYLEVGGLNESYRECFEDVEFNMNLIKCGYTNLYSDTCVCYHHESLTRGKGKMSMDMLKDHTLNLTPFFNKLSHEDKLKILNYDN
jgi:GT2 family glycosyltransferase